MTRKTKHVTRRGFALMLVIAVVAFAAVMGFAMLASSSLRAQVAKNSVDSSASECAAESGIQLAMYYIQHPTTAPTGLQTILKGTGGTWNAGRVSIPSSEGAVDLIVTRVAGSADLYDISSTGYSDTTGSDSHLMTSRVQVALGPLTGAGVDSSGTITAAGLFNGPVTVTKNVTITGRVSSKGAVTTSGNGTVTGAVTATTTAATPTFSELMDYPTNKYWYSDPPKEYSVGVLSSDTLDGTTLGPTSSNPLGIYRYESASSNGTLKIKDNVTINGTLIVRGRVSLRGANNFITAPAGRPALVLERDFEIKGTGDALTIAGAAWIGEGITVNGGNNNSTLRINGALMMNTPLFETGNRDIIVTYTAAKLKLSDFAPGKQTPGALHVLSWSQ